MPKHLSKVLDWVIDYQGQWRLSQEVLHQWLTSPLPWKYLGLVLKMLVLSEAAYVQNPPGNTNKPLPGATHMKSVRTILSPGGTWWLLRCLCLFAAPYSPTKLVPLSESRSFAEPQMKKNLLISGIFQTFKFLPKGFILNKTNDHTFGLWKLFLVRQGFPSFLFSTACLSLEGCCNMNESGMVWHSDLQFEHRSKCYESSWDWVTGIVREVPSGQSSVPSVSGSTMVRTLDSGISATTYRKSVALLGLNWQYGAGCMVSWAQFCWYIVLLLGCVDPLIWVTVVNRHIKPSCGAVYVTRHNCAVCVKLHSMHLNVHFNSVQFIQLNS